jgi:hypothetical protein
LVRFLKKNVRCNRSVLGCDCVGANVGTLSATDGSGGQITYSVESNGYFTVGAATGRLQLAESLDREVSARFML